MARMALSLGRRGSRQAERRERGITESWRAKRILACPFLLTDYGAWHRHLGAQCCVLAQHAAYASQLRPALGAGRAIRTGSAGSHLLLGAGPARPILLGQT